MLCVRNYNWIWRKHLPVLAGLPVGTLNPTWVSAGIWTPSVAPCRAWTVIRGSGWVVGSSRRSLHGALGVHPRPLLRVPVLRGPDLFCRPLRQGHAHTLAWNGSGSYFLRISRDNGMLHSIYVHINSPPKRLLYTRHWTHKGANRGCLLYVRGLHDYVICAFLQP